MNGRKRKQAALAGLESKRSPIVTRARRIMLRLLLDGRQDVTIDDIRDLIEIPAGVNPVCMGSVPGPLVRSGIITCTGFRESARAESHSRPVKIWKLATPAKARRWLLDHPEPDNLQSEAPRRVEGGDQMRLFDNAQQPANAEGW